MKEVNIRIAVNSLSKKGCKFYKSDDGLEIIDISKANDLGNKTWGYIEYFITKAGYVLVGKGDYTNNLKKQYGTSAETPKKVKKDRDNLVKKEVARKWHVNADVEKDSSEYLELLNLNERLTKFNPHIFRKDKAARIDFKNTIHLFKVSKDTVPFNNQKIWSTRYERFEQIPTNK